MLNIKYKLDRIIIPISEEYQELEYDETKWPKNADGNTISKDLCYWDEDTNKIVAKSEEDLLTEYKETAKLRIVASFEKAVKNGKFNSTILGIEVDCRRTDIKNDLQNVQGLISYLTRNSVTSTSYKGYSEVVTATVSKLETLCNEMEDYVLSLYQTKWVLESTIDGCDDRESIDEIKWI